jgi:hypothetical protein
MLAYAVISIPPRSSTFVDLLGPPMKQRGGADALALLLEDGAAGKLGIFELLNRGEVLVDQGRVGQGPAAPRRCSAGCNSGEYGGRKSRWTWSGTRRRRLLCQLAWSSTSTICLGGLAPACRANAASSAANTGMLTVVARWKQVRPEAGWTKPTRERPAKRCCTAATGRCPLGAQMRRVPRFQADALFVGEVGGPQRDRGMGKRRRHRVQQWS